MSDNLRALTIYWTCTSSIKSSNTITSSIVSPGDYLTSCICYSLPNNMIKKKVEVDLFIEMYWCVCGMLYNYVYYLLVYAVVTPGRRSKKKSVSWKRKQRSVIASERREIAGDGAHFVHAQNKRHGNTVLTRAQWDRRTSTVRSPTTTRGRRSSALRSPTTP